MTGPHDRLMRARKEAGYARAVDAARAFGWNENTYTANENGNAPFSKDSAVRYARAFRVELDWLVTGHGPMRRTNRAVPVVGIVGLASVVIAVENGALQPVTPPFGVPDDAKSVIVRGDSMLPVYRDGTYLILQPLADPKEALHRRAMVTLADGSMVIRDVEPGLSPGLFTLMSFNSSPIRDVEIVEAARLIGTVES